MNEEKFITRDRMRYIKNKSSANLAYLAILLNVIYFVAVYQINHTYYYRWIIGISVIYNLIFMLAAFLSSEAVKNYQKTYSIVEVVLGIGQIVRIFILPLPAHAAIEVEKLADGTEASVHAMSSGKFTLCLVCLIASAVCLVASAVINVIKCGELSAHLKQLETQKG